MSAETALFFGGTFDPPNTGHLQLISYILNQTDITDYLIIVPARRSPFKSSERNRDSVINAADINAADINEVDINEAETEKGKGVGSQAEVDEKFKSAAAADRLKMMQMAVLNLSSEDQKRIQLSNVEIMRSEPSYTIHTVTHFLQENPKLRLGILIGDDHLESFRRWQSYLKILRLCPLYVFLRYYSMSENLEHCKELEKEWKTKLQKEYRTELELQEKKFSGIHCLSNPKISSSSSSLRQEMFERKGVDGRLAIANLSDNVRDYILERELYW